ncbi:serpin family protein [Halalkalicoccus ordinarius]|uniref:serpin family protein n=1 Tax=Halalkalicoccus ordinarius TaxID=3116651 RepID=UPI00300EFC99
MSSPSSRREVLSLSGALAGAALAGCLGEASPEDPEPSVSDETLSALVRANAAFALALHRELSAGSDEPNVFASPHSVSVAMAMLFAGARGETEREMAEAMRYELPQETLHPAIESLSGALDERAENADDLGLLDRLRGREATFDLSVTNALWGNEEYPYREAYLEALDDHYGAGLRQVDFTESEATRAEINDWVAGETNDRIEEVLPEGSIQPNTHLVVTNAIHLLADWATQFDPKDTAEGEFTAIDGTSTTTPMMRQKAEFPAALRDGISLVELPYVGEEVSMVVIVPDGRSVEFERFEADLTADRLDALLSDLETSEVEVVLPRFEFGFDAHLNAVLTGLGMERAFDLGRAEFGGMTDATVAIADVFHESYVAVDEAGTEAAAATAGSAADSAPPRVVADRPFLFLIRDRPTGAILFLGRIGDAGALA